MSEKHKHWYAPKRGGGWRKARNGKITRAVHSAARRLRHHLRHHLRLLHLNQRCQILRCPDCLGSGDDSWRSDEKGPLACYSCHWRGRVSLLYTAVGEATLVADWLSLRTSRTEFPQGHEGLKDDEYLVEETRARLLRGR